MSTVSRPTAPAPYVNCRIQLLILFVRIDLTIFAPEGLPTIYAITKLFPTQRRAKLVTWNRCRLTVSASSRSKAGEPAKWRS